MKRTGVVEFGRLAVFYSGIDTLSIRQLECMITLLVEERRRRERASLILASQRADNGHAHASVGAVNRPGGVHASTRGALRDVRLVFTADRDTVSCENLRELSENELDIAMLLLVRKLKQRTRRTGAAAVRAATSYSA